MTEEKKRSEQRWYNLSLKLRNLKNGICFQFIIGIWKMEKNILFENWNSRLK